MIAGPRQVAWSHDRITATGVNLVIERQCEEAFGNRPRVLQSISLQAAVSELARLLPDRQVGVVDTRNVVSKLESLAAAVDRAVAAGEAERERASLAYFLNDLSQRTQNDNEIQDVLYRIGAFELQGAKAGFHRFLIVDDPQLRCGKRDLAALTSGQPYLVWADLSRLPSSGWKQLPQWFPTYETGELKDLMAAGVRPPIPSQGSDNGGGEGGNGAARRF